MPSYHNGAQGLGLQGKRTAPGGRFQKTVGFRFAFSQEGENQLEFYSTLMFRQGSVIDDDIFAVGLASGYDDALYLVEEIAKEVYEKTGDLDIRSYIREQEREEA